jgi:hypothetical protein
VQLLLVSRFGNPKQKAKGIGEIPKVSAARVDLERRNRKLCQKWPAPSPTQSSTSMRHAHAIVTSCKQSSGKFDHRSSIACRPALPTPYWPQANQGSQPFNHDPVSTQAPAKIEQTKGKKKPSTGSARINPAKHRKIGETFGLIGNTTYILENSHLTRHEIIGRHPNHRLYSTG